MDANKIKVFDEEGKEKEFDILFTYEDDETGKNYVLYYDNEDGSEVFASSFDEEGHLFPIEDSEEWDKIEEVFTSFTAQDETEDACAGCHCEGDDCATDCETCDKKN